MVYLRIIKTTFFAAACCLNMLSYAQVPIDNPVATYYDGAFGYSAWTDEIQWMEGPIQVTVTAAGGDYAPLYVSAHNQGNPLEQWFDGIGWIGVRFCFG